LARLWTASDVVPYALGVVRFVTQLFCSAVATRRAVMSTHVVIVFVAVIARSIVAAGFFDRHAALAAKTIGKRTTDQTIMDATNATGSFATQALFDTTRCRRQCRLTGRHRHGTRGLSRATTRNEFCAPRHGAAVFGQCPFTNKNVQALVL